jgi:hypothetical protein
MLNREFPAFQELLQFWTAEYPPQMEDDVRRTIEKVYGTELAAKIAHAFELNGDKSWPSDAFEALFTSEALTLAALGLYSCDHVISTMLGGKLGKMAGKKAGAA